MSDAWKLWPRCPADECDETEDVMIMECAPGYTYMVTGGVCGHVIWLHRETDAPLSDELTELFRPADVPRETSESEDA